MKKLISKKGFTVVELAIVLVIIGIVFAIAAPSVSGYIANAQARNCSTLTHNLFSELKNTITIGRLDADELDATEDGIGNKIKAIVERYTSRDETVKSISGGYCIETDKICDSGTHTITWSFKTISDTDDCISVSASIKCECSAHKNDSFAYNSDIIFQKPGNNPGGGGSGGGGVASGNYSDMMKRLCDEILTRWNVYKTGQLKNTVKKIADFIGSDPLLSAYFTEEQVNAFMDSKYAANFPNLNEYNIMNVLVGDYLFNTVLHPTITYTDADGNTTTYNYLVRVRGTYSNPAEYVYYVNTEGNNSDYARFLCYRTYNNGAYTETWYRYNGKNQINLPGGISGISPDTQSEVNQLIDKRPELFEKLG